MRTIFNDNGDNTYNKDNFFVCDWNYTCERDCQCTPRIVLSLLSLLSLLSFIYPYQILYAAVYKTSAAHWVTNHPHLPQKKFWKKNIHFLHPNTKTIVFTRDFGCRIGCRIPTVV